MQKRSWQKEAESQVEQQYLDSTVWPTLSEPERALWLSHQGLQATTVFVAIPTNRVARFDPQPFRVLMTRRLRLPMPLSSRSCRCGRLLDSLGHHRAGSAEAGGVGEVWVCSGVQRSASVPRGGRACVHECHDEGRRLEVTADGLPLFDGAQLALAVDCSQRRRSTPRRKERTYPELHGAGRRARLVVLAAEVGEKWSDETAQFLRALARHRAQGAPGVMRQRVQSAWLRQFVRLQRCQGFYAVVVGQATSTWGWRAIVALLEQGDSLFFTLITISFHE